MPCAAVYAHRFGSLVRAYQLVGYTPDRDYSYVEINRALRRMHPDVMQQIEGQIASLGGTVQRDVATDVLIVNGEFTVSIVLARCHEAAGLPNRWKIRLDSCLAPDISVAARLESGNQAVRDYYLLPKVDIGSSNISLAERNAAEFESYRFETLDYLYGMAARSRVRLAA